jgi:hypothetical protein
MNGMEIQSWEYNQEKQRIDPAPGEANSPETLPEPR